MPARDEQTFHPCGVCGKDPAGGCTCQECPVCGEAGNPACKINGGTGCELVAQDLVSALAEIDRLSAGFLGKRTGVQWDHISSLLGSERMDRGEALDFLRKAISDIYEAHMRILKQEGQIRSLVGQYNNNAIQVAKIFGEYEDKLADARKALVRERAAVIATGEIAAAVDEAAELGITIDTKFQDLPNEFSGKFLIDAQRQIKAEYPDLGWGD
ncbi:MAG: hypothetical protein A4E49_03165 [Methanosaeta sp. PtaU1.Bin112]|nr:MAG: hypothetical protein A4E49_03165 [Methanosaeta sp. PtaU1.Bin112]